MAGRAKTVKRRAALLQLAGSSEPSTQSLSRSHTQTRGMQRLVMAHWNCVGAHVTSAAGGSGRCKVNVGTGTRKRDGGTGLTAVSLVLAVPAVVLAVTAEDAWNASARVGTLELARQANVNVCRQAGSIFSECVAIFKEGRLPAITGHTAVGLVRVVLTVVVSVTNIGGVGADPCATLELPWPAFELS